jgi:hypothetical protein
VKHGEGPLQKTVLLVAGREVVMACRTENICGGLQGGMDGTMHAAQSMWDTQGMEEDWGFLLVDVKNTFNEHCGTMALWNVRHEWPSGARFVFNSYTHWAILIIRNNNGTGAFLHSKQGVTQGDSLAVFGYPVGLLPLIRGLKLEFPMVTQPWYADGTGTDATFKRIRAMFLILLQLGLDYGYYPEPTKSILVVSTANFARANAEFADLGFKVTTGSRHL